MEPTAVLSEPLRGIQSAAMSPSICSQCGAQMHDRTCSECDRVAASIPLERATSAGDETQTAASPQGGPEVDSIGPYKILSLIAEGGMGAVYLAEQNRPKRRVAVKVIKAGMDTRQVVARFEAEREALAMMDHPNIATVFDAGQTSSGRPFFAMEYVSGIPITDYCDRNHLPTRERLVLFVQVCRAIHHAHQKGIIHRDIKPSNVLVSVVEGRPVPKVIDFGVAKATNQKLTEKTIFTEFGFLIGTPEYMSPEQAEMSGLNVDSTTDIYALGVLLYELLAGVLPFEAVRLRKAGYAEIQRIIREEEPPRPSTKLGSLGATAAEVAKRRQTDPATLNRELRGDLDWITLKCLEKDRTRRYPSASELGADLHRHLVFEPVVARPATAAYRVRRFARRHRAAVAVSTTMLLILGAFALAMALQSRRLAIERDTATRERDRAERVSAFLVSLFEASDPDRSRGERVTARQILDTGRQQLQRQLADQPQTRAALLHTIGQVYRTLDLNDAAEEVLSEALELRKTTQGSERHYLADSMSELGRIHATKGRVDMAETLDREVLRIRQETLGPEHLKVAQSVTNLAANAAVRGRYAEAEEGYRRAAAIALRAGAEAEAAIMQTGIGFTLNRQERFAEAAGVLGEAASTLERRLGPEHSRTLATLNTLGQTLSRLGRYDEAEQVHRRILSARAKLYPGPHFLKAMASYNVGTTLEAKGNYKEAEQHFTDALAIYTQVRPDPHSETAWTLANLALVQRRLGKLESAERTYRSAIEMFTKAPNARPGEVGFAWDGLGDVQYLMGKRKDAELALREALTIRKQTKATGHGLAESKELLARVLCHDARSKEGEELASEAAAIRRSANPPTIRASAFSEAILGRCLVGRNAFSEAEPLLLKAHATLAADPGAREGAQFAAATLAIMYEKWVKPKEAILWRERSCPGAAVPRGHRESSCATWLRPHRLGNKG